MAESLLSNRGRPLSEFYPPCRSFPSSLSGSSYKRVWSAAKDTKKREGRRLPANSHPQGNGRDGFFSKEKPTYSPAEWPPSRTVSTDEASPLQSPDSPSKRAEEIRQSASLRAALVTGTTTPDSLSSLLEVGQSCDTFGFVPHHRRSEKIAFGRRLLQRERVQRLQAN